MAYFPFLIDMEGKSCVIAGGGKIAFRKAEIMLNFGARVTIIAPEICDSIKQLGQRGEITIYRRKIETEDILQADYMIAATDDEKINSYISQVCHSNKILVNVVDVKEECSFIFPAVIKKGDLLISVSTSGNSPAATSVLKEKIERNIPDYYAEMVTQLGSFRENIKEKVRNSQDRKDLYYQLIEDADKRQSKLPEEYILELIEKYAKNNGSER